MTSASSGKACPGECICLARAVSGPRPPLVLQGLGRRRPPPCPSRISSSELGRAPPPVPGPAPARPPGELFSAPRPAPGLAGGGAGRGERAGAAPAREGPAHVPHTPAAGNRPPSSLSRVGRVGRRLPHSSRSIPVTKTLPERPPRLPCRPPWTSGAPKASKAFPESIYRSLIFSPYHSINSY